MGAFIGMVAEEATIIVPELRGIGRAWSLGKEAGSNRPPNMSPPGAGRTGAFKAAKRGLGYLLVSNLSESFLMKICEVILNQAEFMNLRCQRLAVEPEL
jgi:hypothetical protein